MGCLNIIRAITVRILFACHGLISIWRLYDVTRDHRFWYLATTLVGLGMETAITVFKKDGKEWKWFCPSVFIYLLSVVPAIWFLELYEMDKRINFNATNSLSNESARDLHANLGGFLGVPLEIRIPLSLSSDQWIRTLEQFLLLLLILGRWLLPKGKLTHDQLSQLLLVYIGTAADIVEFFEAFKEKEVQHNKLLCIIILSIWSTSLIQFSLVLTASKVPRDKPGSITRKPSHLKRCCQPDVYGIMISMFLQDGPFLALRLTLIFEHRVLSYTNMFFTSKNTLVIILLVYRLIVVQIHKNDDNFEGEKLYLESPIQRSPRIITPIETVQTKKNRQGAGKSNPSRHPSLSDGRSYHGPHLSGTGFIHGKPQPSQNSHLRNNESSNSQRPAQLLNTTTQLCHSRQTISKQRGQSRMAKPQTVNKFNSPVLCSY